MSPCGRGAHRSRYGRLLAVVERLADDGGVVPSADTLLTKAVEIAERHTISVYDAAYAAAADEGGHRLVR